MHSISRVEGWRRSVTRHRARLRLLWVANRYGRGVPFIDPEQRTIRITTLAKVMRAGESYSWKERGSVMGVEYPERVLRSTCTVLPLREGGFDLSFARGRFDPRVVVFDDADATGRVSNSLLRE